jgi:hypothetical protein
MACVATGTQASTQHQRLTAVSASTVASCANNLSPGRPSRSGDYIVASNGILSCSSAPFSSVYIYLERLRWYGWQTLTRRYLPGFALTPFNQWTYRNAVQWNCRGAGTYTYRVEMSGSGGSPSYVHKYGATNRMWC